MHYSKMKADNKMGDKMHDSKMKADNKKKH
jgi:hypothetical protein